MDSPRADGVVPVIGADWMVASLGLLILMALFGWMLDVITGKPLD